MSWTPIPPRAKVEAVELLAADGWLTTGERQFLQGLLSPLRGEWSERQRGWFAAIKAKVATLRRRQHAAPL